MARSAEQPLGCSVRCATCARAPPPASQPAQPNPKPLLILQARIQGVGFQQGVDLGAHVGELGLVGGVEHRGRDELADLVEVLGGKSSGGGGRGATRMPLVTKGERCSLGMEFLFTVRPTDSRSFSASLPVMSEAVRSTRHRWLSVPPETRRRPPSVMPWPRVRQFSTTCSI